jgi:SAM-dependent methyltransferase
LPPAVLAERVVTAGDPDPVATLDAVGSAARATVLGLLPVGWSWEGRRVLDFGCGPGASLRHFMAEAHSAQFYGCDIHAPSIAWVEEHLCPPVRAFVNGDSPPLPLPDGSLDLVFAMAVFGHITDQWSAWLRELHWSVMWPKTAIANTRSREPSGSGSGGESPLTNARTGGQRCSSTHAMLGAWMSQP